ncbi:bifunctional phosphoribosylaminoimidazolecarboxamide formyltransferase/IMP cyclohydrolase [Candidatus Woesearchaeota archaeon]|nr:bifunctional phosphoribosylaminoimidazolecarboxamide formyltransferase/IMP cyclohydrolase [Candidatus Woesearchaeota archaeon]
MKIKTALISVSDKSDLESLLPCLKKHEIEIISTGGSAAKIKELGYDVTEISQITGVDEYPSGLVKTLHPRIHFAILFDRNNPEHMKRLEKEKIKPIDLVICNLYPFEKTVKKQDTTIKDAVANIDIGGVAMIRAAAKNHKYVTIATSPEDYEIICKEIEANDCEILDDLKYELAKKAFRHTAEYDSMISSYLDKNEFPDKLVLNFDKTQKLRYGENPHQQAFFYKFHNLEKEIKLKQLQGKEISYNNYNDLNGVVRILKDFISYFDEKNKEDKVVIISKHINPCGIATSDNLYEAFTRAWNCDKVSAFGSVIGTNAIIDKKTAEFIVSKFTELIIAPGFEEDALSILNQKKNLRLIRIDDFELFKKIPSLDYEFLDFGLIAQSRDNKLYEKLELKSGNLDINKINELIEFGILSIKNIKSNSINMVREHKPGYYEQIGAGIGQPNRVDAVKLCIEKSINNLKEEFNENYKDKIKDLVLISDAFFPFDDNIHLANKFNIKNIVEPGGSIKDNEVIETAKKYDINLVFTGMRHFKH